MSEFWLIAAGLALILEGLLPFAAPRHWRQAMLRLAALGDRQLRILGFAGIALGLGLVLLAAG